jgi:hypothetical protein
MLRLRQRKGHLSKKTKQVIQASNTSKKKARFFSVHPMVLQANKECDRLTKSRFLSASTAFYEGAVLVLSLDFGATLVQQKRCLSRYTQGIAKY